MAVRTKTIGPLAFAMVASVRSSFVSVLINDVSVPSFTDETTDAMDSGASDIALATILAATDDAIYYGSPVPFDYFVMTFGTNRSTGTMIQEYWNGSAWTSVLDQVFIAGNVNMTGGTCAFTLRAATDWATTSVNSVGPHYWMRSRVLTAPGTAGTASWAACGAQAKPASVTVNIPETTSRTILSAFIETSQRLRIGSTIAITRASVQFGSGTPVYVTGTVDHATDVEQSSHRRWWDLTSAFVAGFGSGTSATVTLTQSAAQDAFTAATNDQQNTTFELTITYSFDDASENIRARTIEIPIESQTGTATLTTSLVEQGTNQVPKLTGSGGLIPEDSPTIRDKHFKFIGFDRVNSGTGDFQLGMALDAEAEVLTGVYSNGSTTALTEHIIWPRNDMDATAVHALKLRTTLANAVFQWIGGLLRVSYEYDHGASTRILNHRKIISKPDGFARMGGKSSQRSVHRFCFFIDEPGTLTLRQSGIQITFAHSTTAMTSLSVKVGAQSARSYTQTTTGNPVGDDHSLFQRIDAGGAMGSDAITLVQGWNELVVEVWTGEDVVSSVAAGAPSMLLFLNYESDKKSTGADSHQHTVQYLLNSLAETLSSQEFTPTPPIIPETNYHISNVGISQLISDEADGDGNYTIGILRQSGEGNGQYTPRWVQRLRSAIPGENAIHNDTTEAWKQWPVQPNATDRLMDIETSRAYINRKHSGATGSGARMMAARMYLDYAEGATVSGIILGYTGDGSGITVLVYRAMDNEFVGSTTTIAGGTWDLDVPGVNVEYYETARQSSTLRGRSDNHLPADSSTIHLDSGSARNRRVSAGMETGRSGSGA